MSDQKRQLEFEIARIENNLMRMRLEDVFDQKVRLEDLKNQLKLLNDGNLKETTQQAQYLKG